MLSSRHGLNLLIACAVAATASAAFADNWPQWRGPHGNGVCDERNVPVKWGSKENVAWRLKLPGRAGATPVVWEDRIFLTSVAEDNDTLVLLCVQTDGKLAWRRK